MLTNTDIRRPFHNSMNLTPQQLFVPLLFIGVEIPREYNGLVIVVQPNPAASHKINQPNINGRT